MADNAPESGAHGDTMEATPNQGATVERLMGILDSTPSTDAPKSEPKPTESKPAPKENDEYKEISNPPPSDGALEATEDAEEEVTAEDDSEAEEVEAVEADASDDDAQEEAPSLPTDIHELAESLGVEPSKLFDLKVKTKVDGVEGEATLAQLLKSYQLEGHLNRKSMELSDQRKAFEQEAQQKLGEVNQRTQQLQDAVTLAFNLLNEHYKTVDWQQLKLTDPEAFNTKYIEYQQHQQQIGNAFQTLNAERQRQALAEQEKFVAHVQSESTKLTHAIPEWADEKIAKKEKAEIREYLKSLGFSDQETGQVYDHRQVLILRDALKARQLQQSKPEVMKKVKAAPKLVKPGVKPSKDDVDAKQLRDLRHKHKAGDKQAGIEYLIRRGLV
jgi:hypothetical protein